MISPVPPNPPKTRKKTFEELGKRQQDRRTAELRSEYESQAIIQAAVQHFREIGAKDAAFVLKNMSEDPEKVGGELRKLLVDDSNGKLPQISRSKCLAYILDRSMTREDWDATCRLVNTPGNYRLPSYSVLAEEKKKNRPEGKHKHLSFLFKSKLQHVGQFFCFSAAKTLWEESL